MERIGPYEVERELGRGGMGAVFLARDPRVGRRVAIKLVTNPDVAVGLRRFHTEAQATARLRHPAIVTVHELGEHGGRPYLVLEPVEGGSLKERLARGPLPPREAAELAHALAGALAHAHAQGVLHRDLKPANVLLTSSGAPVLSDFGLARDLSDTRERLTRTGELLGTPAYMSPEQANAEPASVGPAADVYGLGATLYAALTGRPPIAGASLVELLNALLFKTPDPPSALQPGVPPELDAICLRCLEKAPAARYASAAELEAALRRFLAGEEPTRSRALPALAALAAAACAALGALALLTTPDERGSLVARPPSPPAAEPDAPERPTAATTEPREAPRELERVHPIWAWPGRVEVCFTGSHLWVGGRELVAYDLDGAEPRPTWRLSEPPGPLLTLTALANERLLTSFAGEPGLTVRRAAAPEEVELTIATEAPPLQVAVSPAADHPWIAIADGTAVWVQTGDLVARPRWRSLARVSNVRQLVPSSDGALLLAVCGEASPRGEDFRERERALVVWDVATGAERGATSLHEAPSVACALPDGWLVALHGTGPVRRYSPDLGELEQPRDRDVVPGLPHPTASTGMIGRSVRLLWRLSDRRLLTVSGDVSDPGGNEVRLWTPATDGADAGSRWTLAEARAIEPKRGEAVRATVLAVAPDERHVAFVLGSGEERRPRVEVWSLPPP